MVFSKMCFSERKGGALLFFTFDIIISEIETEIPQVKDIQHFQHFFVRKKLMTSPYNTIL